jgi:hypothetical protein
VTNEVYKLYDKGTKNNRLIIKFKLIFMKKILFIILPLIFIIAFSFYGCEDHNSMYPPLTEGIPMQFIGSYNPPGYCINSFEKNLGGNYYAFLSLDTAGIEILNINNPSVPQYIEGYNINGIVEETFVSYMNNIIYLFVAAGGGGIKVLDISNFSNPILDTTLAFPGDYINAVFVDENNKILYAGSTNSKVYIFNIANLPIVTRKTTYATFSSVNEIQVVNNIAYVAQDGGLDIVNVSNPNNPVEISQGSSNDYAYDVKIIGTIAVIANNANGVLLIDVSNPANPREISYLDTYDAALACSINGNLVYVAEDQSGVETFDISNPSNPVFLAYATTNSFSVGVSYFNGHVYVSNYDDFLVLKYPY